MVVLVRVAHTGALRDRIHRDRRRELVRAQAASPDAGRRSCSRGAPTVHQLLTRHYSGEPQHPDSRPRLRGRHASSRPGESSGAASPLDDELAVGRSARCSGCPQQRPVLDSSNGYVPGLDGYGLDDTIGNPRRPLRDSCTRRKGNGRRRTDAMGPAPRFSGSQDQGESRDASGGVLRRVRTAARSSSWRLKPRGVFALFVNENTGTVFDSQRLVPADNASSALVGVADRTRATAASARSTA